jgi:hypothetical protein
MERTHWQDWLVLIVGLALIAAPFFFGYILPEGLSQTLVTTAFVVTGLAALVTGGVGSFTDQSWEEWVTAALGVWLIAMPWIVGFHAVQTLMWTAVMAGIVLFALASLALRDIMGESGA